MQSGPKWVIIMDELLKILSKQATPKTAWKHLANHLELPYATIKQWVADEAIPEPYASEVSYLFGISKEKLL